MQSLTLSARFSTRTEPLEDFVDEEEVPRLLARPAFELSPQAFRIAAWPPDLVLAAEAQDYAGVVASIAQRVPPLETVPLRLGWRRAAAPELAGAAPVRQRGWLAGVIGAFFTAVIALLWVAFAR